MKQRPPLVAPALLAIAIAIALGACASDDDDDASAATSTEATSPTTDQPMPVATTTPETTEPISSTSGDSASPSETTDDDSRTIDSPVTITYDGGIYVLDGETLDVAADIPLDGFNRVAPAGNDTHVVVSTSAGFRLLDAVHGTMTDVTVPGEEPGHVVTHAGTTILFMDGTGEVLFYDSDELGDGTTEPERYQSAHAHHGVSVRLDDGTIVNTLGNSESRPGAIALDADHDEIARNEDCEGVHGEAVAHGEVVSLGCRDGVLLFKDGQFVKVDAGPEYAATGTQAGSSESPILLADYAVDAEAEFERPTQFALVDTVAETITPVPMPNGASYSFRSLGRGAHGEAYVLGTDGALHVIDPETAELTASWPVVGAWEEPMDWQEPRPAIFGRDHDVYVTEPATNTVYRLDGETGEVLARVELEATPNEISGVLGAT